MGTKSRDNKALIAVWIDKTDFENAKLVARFLGKTLTAYVTGIVNAHSSALLNDAIEHQKVIEKAVNASLKAQKRANDSRKKATVIGD